jgi:phosphoenolpyruvate carboxylase
MDAHIDMQESTKDLAERLAQDSLFRAVCNGDKGAMSRIQRDGSQQVSVDMRKEVPLGRRQVESLLRFMVSDETYRDMKDAERDNIVYDGLGEHRILGKKKKKGMKKGC